VVSREYTGGERFGLWVVAGLGFVGVNGAFVYGLLARPDALAAALRNPLAAAFMVEALVLVALLAYLLEKWNLSRLHWGWFVALSILGSLAFALPVALLWRGQPRAEGAAGPPRLPQ